MDRRPGPESDALQRRPRVVAGLRGEDRGPAADAVVPATANEGPIRSATASARHGCRAGQVGRACQRDGEQPVGDHHAVERGEVGLLVGVGSEVRPILDKPGQQLLVDRRGRVRAREVDFPGQPVVLERVDLCRTATPGADGGSWSRTSGVTTGSRGWGVAPCARRRSTRSAGVAEAPTDHRKASRPYPANHARTSSIRRSAVDGSNRMRLARPLRGDVGGAWNRTTSPAS